MIECGLPWNELLGHINHKIDNIKGCIITHSHKDHSKAVDKALKHTIDCYASQETLEALGVSSHRRASSDFSGLKKHGFSVVAFNSQHDCPGSKFFVIGCDGKSMLFSTDNYWIDKEFRGMKFNIIAIESSFDEDILQYKVDKGEINEELAKRLLFSHMSNKRCKKYLREKCDLSHCEEINLIHMSASNNIKDRVKQQFESEFLIPTIICGD